jgi:protein LSM14
LECLCRSQLAKAKIDAGTENEKKDDSGNETGAGDNEPEEEPDVVHYDKAKSFFDNISCEAVERSKGLVGANFILYLNA